MAVEERIATFYCQHSACDAIDWTVNGTSLNRISSPDIVDGGSQVDDAGNRAYSISISTSLEYNMTKVECVAYFSSGRQLTSPVVMLLIQGSYTISVDCLIPVYILTDQLHSHACRCSRRSEQCFV